MSGNPVVAGRFELLELAAKGGMGAVYRALDRQTGETVALKVLLGDTDNAALRLTKEGEVLAELIDPGVVRYVAHGLGDDGRPFVAMAWVDGETLADRIVRQPLSHAESVELVMGIAEALGHAHEHGVVHRDVKPSNIVLSGGEIRNPVLIDFGLVRLRASEQTQAHRAMGTPSYMAPEQARCASEVDSRADVFSLGCVLFRCLTGAVPFAGPDMLSVLTKILLEEAPRVSELVPWVASDLDALVEDMLSKDRDMRPLNGREVADRLRKIEVSEHSAAHAIDPLVLRAGLTHDELRLRSIIVADVRLPPLSFEGVVSALAQAQLERVRRQVEPFDARADLLADGSLVVALANRGGAAELSMRAASCALGLRAVLSGAAIALVTGSGVFAHDGSASDGEGGDVFSRAAAMLRDVSQDPRHASASYVAIDEVTACLVEARFEVVRTGPLTLLRAQRSGEDASRTVLGKATRFFGRDLELSTLGGLVDAAFDESRAQVALVTAPAGLGKSRLGSEVLAAVRARRPTAKILLARGDPMSVGSPFGLLAQMVKRAARLRDGETLEARSASLKSRIGESITDTKTARIAAFLGEIVGAPTAAANVSVELRAARANPVTMGDQIRRAFEDFLEAELAEHPVLVVIEDLQWGDLPTVNALDAALRNLAERPLAVLAFARPEVFELFPNLWAQRSVERVSLAPLPKKVAERIAWSLLGDGAPPDRVASLVSRAAGNAFFLEEMIRASATSPTLAFPDTVVAMVQARLEALPSELRRTLRAASVFGQTLWVDGVGVLLGLPDPADVLPAISELVALELLTPSYDARFVGHEQLTFSSALTREAAYASLTDQDRALGHGLAADWLLEHGETDARVLAEHLERGGAMAEAIAWWARAAEDALAGADFDAVIDRGRRGVACGARGEELAHLHVLMIESWAAKGKYHAVRESALLGLQHAQRGSDSWIALASQAVVASVHVDDLPSAVAWIDDVCDAFHDRKDASAALAVVILRTASSLMRGAARDQAWRLRDLVEPLVHKHAAHAPTLRGYAAFVDGIFQIHDRSDFGAAAESFSQAIAAFEQSGDLREIVRERVNLGYALTRLGDGSAAGVLRGAYEEAQRMGLVHYAAGAAQNLALALARAGDFDGARAFISLSIATSEGLGVRLMTLWSQLYAAEIARLAGDWAGAEELARAVRPELAAHASAYVYASATLSHALREQGRVGEALDVATDAIGVLEAAAIVEEGEEQARLAFAQVLMDLGDVGAAHAAIRKAREVVLSRASLIGDGRWRRSYLEQNAENAAIVALARQWLSDA